MTILRRADHEASQIRLQKALWAWVRDNDMELTFNGICVRDSFQEMHE